MNMAGAAWDKLGSGARCPARLRDSRCSGEYGGSIARAIRGFARIRFFPGMWLF